MGIPGAKRAASAEEWFTGAVALGLVVKGHNAMAHELPLTVAPTLTSGCLSCTGFAPAPESPLLRIQPVEEALSEAQE